MQLMAWLMLMVAVLANIMTNFALKRAVMALDVSSFSKVAVGLLTSAWAWGGILSGFVLLGSYMFAIRYLPLGLAYMAITGLVMIALTVIDFATGTPFSLARVLGAVLVVSGLTLVKVSAS